MTEVINIIKEKAVLCTVNTIDILLCKYKLNTFIVCVCLNSKAKKSK